jgi:hypothetical protein
MKFSVWTAFLLPPPRYARRPSHDQAAAVSIQIGEPAVSPREADPEIEHVVVGAAADRAVVSQVDLGSLRDGGDPVLAASCGRPHIGSRVLSYAGPNHHWRFGERAVRLP